MSRAGAVFCCTSGRCLVGGCIATTNVAVAVVNNVSQCSKSSHDGLVVVSGAGLLYSLRVGRDIAFDVGEKVGAAAVS